MEEKDMKNLQNDELSQLALDNGYVPTKEHYETSQSLRKNEYIFNTKETGVIEGGTNYEHTSFLAEKFYETYKQQIIQSRKNGHIDIIYKT